MQHHKPGPDSGGQGTKNHHQPGPSCLSQAVLDGLDSVEVAPAKSEGDAQSSGGTYAAEEQLWRHEFFRDCLAPKKAAFKVS